MFFRQILFCYLTFLITNNNIQGQYLPDWNSLDTRPLPQWYDDAKLGIFIHWGVYSVPSFGSEWFWKSWKEGANKQEYEAFMAKNYEPGFSYQDFAHDFTAEFFDPNQWADLFQASGAKYVVLTSKHHEGYTLWPSKFSFSWNSMDVGPHRDLIDELAKAIRNKTTIKFGLYHSLYEWYNPLWLWDKSTNFSTNSFVDSKVYPEMIELVNAYKPEVIWSDGEWEAPDWYWNSTKFIAWLYNSSPVKDTIVVNDRWGDTVRCKHGDFYTCADNYNPGVLQKHKWENCMTIDTRSWGYRRNILLNEILTREEIIATLMSTVSCGGNLLIDVGPTKEGTIMPIFQQRLRELGSWLQINGEAVYASRPWTFQNETVQTGIWYTKRDTFVYAAVLNWPTGNILVLNLPEAGVNNQVFILGYATPIKSYSQHGAAGITISLPDISRVNVSLPWVLKLTNIIN